LDTINDAPCGGSNTVGNRVEFPIKGGFIKGVGYHRKSTTYFKLSLKSSQSANSDFTKEIHPSTYAERSGPFAVGPLDLSKIAGVTNGAVGTIQVMTYDSHDYSYKCSDVVFKGESQQLPAPSTPTTVPAGTGQTSPTTTAATTSETTAPATNGTFTTATSAAMGMPEKFGLALLSMGLFIMYQ
jgi:hypothetical protein